MKILAFDIGGTITKLAIIDEKLNILYHESYSTNSKKGGKWIVDSVIKKINSFQNIEGVAISSGGVIDYRNGKIIYANSNIPNYSNIDFKKIIKNETGLNASLENDVNCFALAENIEISDNFIMLTIGTGIGGAIIIDNKIYHGNDFSAGEFGQIFIGDDIFENKASITSLVKTCKNYGLDVESGIDVFSLYDQKNEFAKEAVNIFYQNLAVGIINLGYIFNCNIYLGGGVTSRKSFLNELNEKINQIKDPNYFKSQVKIAKYQNNGGLIGAVIHYKNFYEKRNI